MNKKNLIFSIIFVFFLLFGLNYSVKAEGTTCTYSLTTAPDATAIDTNSPYAKYRRYLYIGNYGGGGYSEFNKNLEELSNMMISTSSYTRKMDSFVVGVELKLNLDTLDASLKSYYSATPVEVQTPLPLVGGVLNWLNDIIFNQKDIATVSYNVEMDDENKNIVRNAKRCPDAIYFNDPKPAWNNAPANQIMDIAVDKVIYVDNYDNAEEELLKVEKLTDNSHLKLALFLDADPSINKASKNLKEYIAGEAVVNNTYYYENSHFHHINREAGPAAETVQEYLIFGLKDVLDEITSISYSANDSTLKRNQIDKFIEDNSTTVLDSLANVLVEGNGTIYESDKFKNDLNKVNAMYYDNLKNNFNLRDANGYVTSISTYFTSNIKNGYDWFKKYGKDKIDPTTELAMGQTFKYNIFYVSSLTEILKFANDNYDELKERTNIIMGETFLETDPEKACKYIKAAELEKCGPAGSEGYKQCTISMCSGVSKKDLEQYNKKQKEENDKNLNDSLKVYLTDMFEGIGIEIPKENEFCELLFDPDNENGIYPYIEFVINLIRIGGPLLVIFLTAFDGIKMVTSFKGEEENKKFLNHLKIRLISLALLILVPTIIKFVIDIFGMNYCSI